MVQTQPRYDPGTTSTEQNGAADAIVSAASGTNEIADSINKLLENIPNVFGGGDNQQQQGVDNVADKTGIGKLPLPKLLFAMGLLAITIAWVEKFNPQMALLLAVILILGLFIVDATLGGQVEQL